ncbi:MAG: PPOX class F420-dependent oxidoreductase [Dehalococcoidia bacterium]
MTAQIPASHIDILHGKNLAHVATLMPDGSPQSTPVWVDYDGESIIFNTADGRQKARNLDRDARVAISIHDSANPYRYLQVRGVISEKTFVGADAHIDKLANKYLGVDRYPGHDPAQKRVIYKVRPAKVQVMG